MFAQKFTQYILKGRRQATLVAFFCALLPFMGLPLLVWISNVIIALVTLRKGTREGLFVLLWVAIPSIAFGFYHSWIPLLNFIVCGSLIVWILATILRRFSSWGLTLQFAAMIGLVAVLLVHIYAPNVHAWWVSQIVNIMTTLTHKLHVNIKIDQIKQLATTASLYATGLQATSVLLFDCSELILARFLESTVSSPKTFRKEWLQLRLPRLFLIGTIVGLLLALFGPVLFKDIVPVLLLPFLFAGTSLAHTILVKLNAGSIWFAIFYILLIIGFIIFPLFLGLIVIIAMIDSLFNLRTKFKLMIR